MLKTVFNSLFGGLLGREENGPTNAEVTSLHYHNKFSDFLPYFAYDDATGVYHNTDGSRGMIWECTPLVFSAEKTLQISEALVRLPLPPMSVIQVSLYSDRNIKPFLEAYRWLRATSDNPLVHDAVDSYCNFLEKCTTGIPQLSNIPLRNVRLIVSLKVPAKGEVDLAEATTSIQENLNAMRLRPRIMRPEGLLEWLRRMLNDTVPERKLSNGAELASYYDDNLSIGKQILMTETPIDVEDDHIQIGNRYWKCIIPMTYPKNVDPLETKELFGGIWGVRSDNEQHRTPFLYSLNIIFDKLKNTIRNKCDVIMMQKGAGSFARTLYRKQDEHEWASDAIDQGVVFGRVMPMMWFIGDTYEQADEAAKRGKTMWESAGYVMQEEKSILSAMLLSALPMGLRATPRNIKMLERDQIVDAAAICNILPIQGDFSGSSEAVMLQQGRSGQIVPLSIFSKLANNFNGFVAATSGGGKSFFVNNLCFSHYTSGTILRIVDIGGSYKKLCHILDEQYLDFAPGNNLCINPFSNIVDVDEDLSAIATIVMQMCYSTSDAPVIEEEEHTLVRDAVKWAYAQKGNGASVDDVYLFLREYPDHLPGNRRVTAHLEELAHHLAYNMFEFTSEGSFGKYFVGESTFNIADSRFLLLELEALKNNRSLFKVITLLVLDAVTRDLYLSDRSQRRMVVFDEAWQFLSGASGNTMMADMIEAGFRRARKYSGSFIVITQSILDRQVFGKIGDIIWANADYKILLESKDYDKALAEKLIDYDEFTVEILKSMQRNGTKYSEIYMDTPFGAGVVRLAVDPFSYYLFTSHAEETAEMDRMVAGGLTYREAIHEMVRKYRS
ncbi:TraC family protein [Geomonas subterranea]|uniref:TraC family protein n=1 Tax=Geomonas subterranea TaxID=2847989 RepID=UPI001CD2B7C6|nr:TraC family protein [Geomonas fuzhouensis]